MNYKKLNKQDIEESISLFFSYCCKGNGNKKLINWYCEEMEEMLSNESITLSFDAGEKWQQIQDFRKNEN